MYFMKTVNTNNSADKVLEIQLIMIIFKILDIIHKRIKEKNLLMTHFLKCFHNKSNLNKIMTQVIA